VGRSPAEAQAEGLLSSDDIVTSIERDGSIIHPVDDTTVRPDDVVTVLPKESSGEEVLEAFIVEEDETPPPTS